MENKHKLTVEEVGALRHLVYQNIFSLEPAAFQINEDFSEDDANEAMVKIDKNYKIIEKLHLMAHETKDG